MRRRAGPGVRRVPAGPARLRAVRQVRREGDRSLSGKRAQEQERAASGACRRRRWRRWGQGGSGRQRQLRAAKGDADELVRRYADRALAAIGEERLRDLLAAEGRADSDKARIKAMWDLVEYRMSDEVATRLLERLKDPSAPVRAQAANLLGGCELDHGRIIPALISMTKDKDRDVRLMSLHSLIRFGKKSAVAVPHIHDCVKDTDALISAWALGVVNVSGQTKDQATFDLVVGRIMTSDSAEVQRRAVCILGNSEIHTDQVANLLLFAVQSGKLKRENKGSDPYSAALQVLGRIAPMDPKGDPAPGNGNGRSLKPS